MFNKLKSVFKSKPSNPVYRHYNPSELKMITMKSRIVLDEYYKKCLKEISEKDKLLQKNKNLSTDAYRILQQIGIRVIEVESIKIYIQLLRKIEERSVTIIKTNGDIALMREQLRWFQAVLWFRKTRQFSKLQQLHQFCFNFFKGIDITMEINVKCEIFSVYPILRYLDPSCVLPLQKLEIEISNHIKTVLEQPTIDEIFAINKRQIRNWFKRQQVEYRDKFLSHSKSKSPNKPKSPVPTRRKKESPPKNEYMMNSLKPLNEIYAKQEKESQEQIERRKRQEMFKHSFMRRINSTQNTVPQEKSEDQIKPTQPTKQEEKDPEDLVKQECQQCKRSITLISSFGTPSKINSRKDFSFGDEARLQSGNLGSQMPILVGENIIENSYDQQVLCTSCLKQQLSRELVPEPEQKLQENEEIQTYSEKLIQPQFTEATSLSNELDQIPQQDKINYIPQENEHNSLEEPEQNYFIKDSMMRLRQSDDREQEADQIRQNIGNDQLEQLDGEQVIKEQKTLDDEEQSLQFIREIIKEEPKKIKKPYMVSIYARADVVGR